MVVRLTESMLETRSESISEARKPFCSANATAQSCPAGVAFNRVVAERCLRKSLDAWESRFALRIRLRFSLCVAAPASAKEFLALRIVAEDFPREAVAGPSCAQGLSTLFTESYPSLVLVQTTDLNFFRLNFTLPWGEGRLKASGLKSAVNTPLLAAGCFIFFGIDWHCSGY
jgi:hypothetical protein